MSAPFEHASEVRDALCSIVADPGLGPGSLAHAQTAANLLRDLLPDAPRETSLLLAAIAAGAPAMLGEYVAQGMAGETAIRLTAAALASRTAFTAGACQWVVTELGVALSLVPAVPVPAAQIEPHPPAEVSAEISAAPLQEPTCTAVPGPFRPEPVRPRRRSSLGRLALLAVIGLALAAVVGAGLYAALPGGAAHHRNAPGRRQGGTPTVPVIVGTPDNAWIAQFASVSLNAGTAARDSVLARVRLDVPHAQLLNTGAYASLRPGYWVIYYAGHITTGTQALAYCAAHGRATRDLCIGRYLSNNPADAGYQCYPPAASPSGNCTHPPAPSPAGVVKAYIAAVNQHSWARVWALGGKNLGQSYRQLIAGYAHTGYVQITRITANGPAVTVLTTATETNGTTQRYRLSYLVSNGTITAGQSTLIPG
jgi:hypothetical protein